MLTLIVWQSKNASVTAIRKVLGKNAVCDASDDERRPTWIKPVKSVKATERLIRSLRSPQV